MIRVHDDDEPVTAHHDGCHPSGRGVMAFHEADLGAAAVDAGQDLRGVRDLDRQHDIGGFLVQGTDPAGQQVLGDGQGRRDPQPRAFRGHHRRDTVHHGLGRGQHPAAEGSDLPPGRGQPGPRRATLQQRDAQSAFQLAHAHADGSLGDTVTGRRLAEAAQLGHGIQELQSEQIRRRSRQHKPNIT